MKALFIWLCSTALLYGQETIPLTADEIKESIANHLIYESDNSERFIIYRGFVVHYRSDTKTPKFTIHQLTAQQISHSQGSKAKRRSNFFIDEFNLDDNSARNIDFRKSGFDRGHLVPAGDFYWNQTLKNETFVLSNVCPQRPSLNRGVWAALENLIRQKVQASGHAVYIITGVLYSQYYVKTIGPGKVGVPAYFYKLLFIPDSKEMFAFMFDHSIDFYSNRVVDFQVTVDDIEIITKEDFFDRLPDELENMLESRIVPFNLD